MKYFKDFTIPLYIRGWQNFSVKGQRLNMLGFVGHMQSLSHNLLCWYLFVYNPLMM